VDGLITGQLKNLFHDYFTDLRKKETTDRQSHYETLKTLRGAIKGSGMKSREGLSGINIPSSLSRLRPLLAKIRGRTPLDVFKIGLLSQNRGAGIPPTAVFGRSMAQFVKTVTEPVESLTPSEVSLLCRATNEVWVEITYRAEKHSLAKAMESWARKSEISISDSACLGVARADGGKFEFARMLIQKFKYKGVRRVDLHDGSLTRTVLHLGGAIPTNHWVRIGTFDFERVGIGEYIFNICANMLRDDSKWESRGFMSGKASSVETMGKVRIITVSHFVHATFLHPFSDVLAEALKTVPDARSGFEKSNHLWEFYKRLNRENPSSEFLFDSVRRKKWVLSTDWSEATDHSHPEVATVLLGGFSARLGVPAWYRESCTSLLTRSRLMYIDHQLEVGESHPKDFSPVPIRTVRGVFQGDPGCKSFLHLAHLVSRKVAKHIFTDVCASRIREDPYDMGDNPLYEGRSSSIASLKWMDSQDRRKSEESRKQ